MTKHYPNNNEVQLKQTDIVFSNDLRMTVVAGNNVLEDLDLAIETANTLKRICERLGLNYVYKASFDKANRSSVDSYRGPGLKEGLKILAEVKSTCSVAVITDVHEKEQCKPVAEVADIIQIPAFLVRQTDLIAAAAQTKKPINLKKMQMMAPKDLQNTIDKFKHFGNGELILCERGTSFGYGNLIVDPLGVLEMKKLGWPVMFDITHSLQQPGGLGKATAGRGEDAYYLAKSIVSLGISSIFLETHPDPSKAKCDGPCATKLDEAEVLLTHLAELDRLVKRQVNELR